MNVNKATIISIQLSPEEIEKILTDYVLNTLHSQHMIDLLPDGSLRTHKIEKKRFDVGSLGCYEMSLTQTTEK